MKIKITFIILFSFIFLILTGCSSTDVAYFRVINSTEKNIESIKVYIVSDYEEYKKLNDIRAGEKTSFHSYKMFDSSLFSVTSGGFLKTEILFKNDEKQLTMLYEDMKKEIAGSYGLVDEDKFELEIKSDEVIYRMID